MTQEGDSFPDIGVLENLSEILDLKIQDIVAGEIRENNDKDAVTELVRVAKLQTKEKYRNLLNTCIGFIIICYLFLIGYWGLSGSAMGMWSTFFYCCSLFFVLLVISANCVCDNKSMNPFQDKVSKWITIAVILIGAYGIALMCFAVCIVNHGNTPFNMELSSVGPFLNNRFILIFLFNIIVIVIEYFIMNRKDISIHLGIYFSSAVIHLMFIYSNVLHRMITLGYFFHMVILNTVVVFSETILVIAATFVIKKARKRE